MQDLEGSEDLMKCATPCESEAESEDDSAVFSTKCCERRRREDLIECATLDESGGGDEVAAVVANSGITDVENS